MRFVVVLLLLVAAARRAYGLVAGGFVTVDLGVGRRVRPLGPVTWRIKADRETVFDLLAAPYAQRAPRAMREKVQVWERGSDMVLAAHLTPVKCGVTTTVETVGFTRPERFDFRVVRGPVPHVKESFVLEATEDGTTLTWSGELGTDLGALGSWWGDTVARSWDKAVRASLEPVVVEAERRYRAP